MGTFFEPPMVQLVKEINDKNKSTLTRALTASDFRIRQLAHNAVTGIRTVKLIATPESGLFGAVNNPGVTYERYSCATMWHIPPRVLVADGVLVTDVLNELSRTYNIPNFTVEPAVGDIVNPYDFPKEIIGTTVQFNGESSVTIELPVRSDSVGWYGPFRITCWNSAVDLGKLIPDANLIGLRYPDDTEGEDGSLSTLTFPVKFVDLPVTLAPVFMAVNNRLPADPENADIQELVKRITDHYGELGTDIDADDLSLTVAGAVVISTNLTDSTATEKQVILETVPVDGSIYKGRLYINRPTIRSPNPN